MSKCIEVHRSDSGRYTIPDNAEFDDFAEVTRALGPATRISSLDAQGAWTAVYRIIEPSGILCAGSVNKTLYRWFFVAE
jgi:hypothetical protein